MEAVTVEITRIKETTHILLLAVNNGVYSFKYPIRKALAEKVDAIVIKKCKQFRKMLSTFSFHVSISDQTQCNLKLSMLQNIEKV